MNKNVGRIDTVGRVIVAVGIGLAAIFGLISGWVSLAASLVLLTTGIAGFCPLYSVCGVSSNRKLTEKE